MTSAELLEQLGQAWTQAGVHHRDALVDVGRQVRHYLQVRAAELVAAGYQTCRNQTPRATALREASQRLQVSESRVYELMGVWAVVDLVGGGDLGQLTYSTLRKFRPLVERVGDGEEWQVVPAYREWAQDLVRQAVAEGWGSPRTRDEVFARTRPSKHGPKRAQTPAQYAKLLASSVEKEDRVNMASVVRAARQANPRDLADLITDMVAQSLDPEATARLVREGLAGVRPAREKVGF